MHFSGAREVFIYTGEVFMCTAGEVFIHFSGAGEAEEVFIYTHGLGRKCDCRLGCSSIQLKAENIWLGKRKQLAKLDFINIAAMFHFN